MTEFLKTFVTGAVVVGGIIAGVWALVQWPILAAILVFVLVSLWVGGFVREVNHRCSVTCRRHGLGDWY